MKPATLLVLVLACFFQDGQDEALKEFRRAFRPAKDPASVQERRTAALGALRAAAGGEKGSAIAGRDATAMADMLLNAHCQLDRELAPIRSERREFLLGGPARKEIKLRTTFDPLIALQEGIEAALRELKDLSAVEAAVSRALTDRKLGLSLRIALAERAGESEGVTGRQIEALLRKTKNAGALLLGLAAARGQGRAAAVLGDRVLSLLEHAEPAVRESAAAALATMCVRKSLAALVDRLGKEETRCTSNRIAAALQILTRQNLGTSAHAWRRWLDGAGKPFVDGDAALGGGTNAVKKPKKSSTPRYHQIPMDGGSIIYLIDCSKSMNQTLTKPSKKAGPGEESRFARAKDELLRALRHLSPAKRFNIVAFEGRCRIFSEKMVPADKKNITRATQWITYLQLKFGTNIFDALETAFSLAGRGTEDRYYDAEADTIFLLTDGLPVLGSGKGDSFSKIRAAVKRWNLLRRVVVHTIGLGDGIPKNGLKRLAAENGGKFVHEAPREPGSQK